MSETAKERHWRQWAIDGMPKDKQRLAEATWEAAQSANETMIRIDECRRIMHALDMYPPASDYGPPIKERVESLANSTDSGNHQ